MCRIRCDCDRLIEEFEQQFWIRNERLPFEQALSAEASDCSGNIGGHVTVRRNGKGSPHSLFNVDQGVRTIAKVPDQGRRGIKTEYGAIRPAGSVDEDFPAGPFGRQPRALPGLIIGHTLIITSAADMADWREPPQLPTILTAMPVKITLNAVCGPTKAID